MPYVICQPCVGVKNGACVDACPNDAIHPRPDEEGFDTVNQLYINPSACGNCGLCAMACEVNAIYPQSSVPPAWQSFIATNAGHFSE